MLSTVDSNRSIAPVENNPLIKAKVTNSCKKKLFINSGRLTYSLCKDNDMQTV